jgi:hypothetical protein
MPVLDQRTVMQRLGVSDEAARLGIQRLADAGVMRELTARKRDRVWEASELFSLLDEFESDVISRHQRRRH